MADAVFSFSLNLVVAGTVIRVLGGSPGWTGVSTAAAVSSIQTLWIIALTLALASQLFNALITFSTYHRWGESGRAYPSQDVSGGKLVRNGPSLG